MRVAWALVVVAGCGRFDFDSVPTPVVPPATDVQLALGRQHACLRTNAGALWCWGLNATGELGLGQAMYGIDSKVPVQVGAASTWTDVAPGWRHTCALDAVGHAWCWGTNANGQLGIAAVTCGDGIVQTGETCDDANQANSDGCNALCQTTPAIAPDVVDPTQVSGGHTFRRIFAGSYHTCAIASDGTLWCWGRNGAGELGLGTNGAASDRSVPTQVTIPGSPDHDDEWQDIAGGDDHTCGLQEDLSLWCWGSVADGQLGASTNRFSPGLVEPGSTWRAAGAGRNFGCAIGDDTRVYCLGLNDMGQLGVADTMNRDTPTELTLTNADRVGAGITHSCARLRDGSAWCWGGDDDGELGDGTVQAFELSPTQVVGIWTDIAAGNQFSCALDASEAVWCWGSGANGRLGNGMSSMQSLPVAVQFP